jgi:hypothetical protein
MILLLTAIPTPIQFLSFSILNLMELPFLMTEPSISPNLSEAVLLQTAVLLLSDRVMLVLSIR